MVQTIISRPLTERGRKQAASVAAWLTQHLPRQLRIISARRLVRTCQTAEALGLPFQVEAGVGPESGTQDVLATIGWPPARGSVLLVGHQPGLGHLASLLLGGQEADWSIKKGSALVAGGASAKASHKRYCARSLRQTSCAASKPADRLPACGMRKLAASVTAPRRRCSPFPLQIPHPQREVWPLP